MEQKIFLNISEIASFINQNKWSPYQAFDRLWKKYDTINYNILLDQLNNDVVTKHLDLKIVENDKKNVEEQLKNKEITKRQFTKLIKEITVKEESLTRQVNQTIKQLENTTLNQNELITKIAGDVDLLSHINSTTLNTSDKRKLTNKAIENIANITIEQKQELLIKTESLINTTHGVLHEDSAIDMFEKKCNVKLDVSQKYYKSQLKQATLPSSKLAFGRGTHIYFLGGKMDGINHDDKYVVEVKNRTKGFFSSVRDYEMTQIQIYMYLTGYDNAKLVECFNNKIRITEIQRDQDYINDIFDYLSIFIANFEKFLVDDKSKMEYITLSSEYDKKAFLDVLYLNEIAKEFDKKTELRLINQCCLIDDLD